MEYKLYDEKQYNARTKYYTGTKGANERIMFEEFMYNAVQRYATSGDPTHLNNAIKAAQNVGRYRSTFRVVSACSAHKFNAKLKIFKGEAHKGRLANIRENWEIIFYEAMADEIKHSATTPTFDWSKKQTTLIKLVTDAIAHGVSAKEIEKVVHTAEAKAARKHLVEEKEEQQPIMEGVVVAKAS